MSNYDSALLEKVIMVPLDWSKVMNCTDCAPIQTVYKDRVDLAWIQALFGVLYSVVLVFGFVANVMTLICLISRSCQLGLNVKFLISLGVSDLFIGLTSLPMTAIQIFARKWPWGVTLCRYVPLFQGASFFINSFTLVAIAVERYFIIARETTKGKVRRNVAVLVIIWLFGVCASLPYALYMELKPVCATDDRTNATVCLCGEFCEESWPHESAKRGYGSAAFSAQFGLPLCVLAFCYWRVEHTVSLGVKRRLNKENLSLISRQRLIRRKKRTANITLLLIMCFVAPWMPVNVLNLLRDYKTLPDEYVSILFAVGHLIAMTSILWNPVIYCWYNKQFFDAFKGLLTCKGLSSTPFYSSNNETYQAGGERGTATSCRSKAPSTHLTQLASYHRRTRSRLSTVSSNGYGGRRSRLPSNVSVQLAKRNSGRDSDETSRICFEKYPVRKAFSADPSARKASMALNDADSDDGHGNLLAVPRSHKISQEYNNKLSPDGAKFRRRVESTSVATASATGLHNSQYEKRRETCDNSMLTIPANVECGDLTALTPAVTV